LVLEDDERDAVGEVTPEQFAVCRKYGAAPYPPLLQEKFGVSASVLDGEYPLNGLRHAEEAGTSGWFIWSGEVLAQDDRFFLPLHGNHLTGTRPEVNRFLALPPGWRFLISADYEDVWFDQSLID